MAYLNSDGLYRKVGREQGTAGAGGEYGVVADGHDHVFALTIDLVDLGTAAAIQSDAAILPSGAFIKKVEVETLVAVTGASAAMNIGTVRLDRSTLGDVDGLGKAAVLTTTAMAAKGTILTYVVGTTNAGDEIGTELATPRYVTADYDTAAFTAGRVEVRIYWSKQTT